MVGLDSEDAAKEMMKILEKGSANRGYLWNRYFGGRGNSGLC